MCLLLTVATMSLWRDVHVMCGAYCTRVEEQALREEMSSTSATVLHAGPVASVCHPRHRHPRKN